MFFTDYFLPKNINKKSSDSFHPTSVWTHITNTLTDNFSSMLGQITQLRIFKDETPFFLKAKQETKFQHYLAWCSEIRQIEKQLLAQLTDKKRKPNDFFHIFSAQKKKLKTKILSPIYYDQRLKKLEEKLNSFPAATRLIHQKRLHLLATLQSNSQLALEYFYNDTINHIIQLSGRKLLPEKLIKSLNYYHDLIPLHLYESVITTLHTFITTHHTQLDRMDDVYLEHIVEARHFENLMSTLNTKFAPFDSEQLKKKKDKNNNRTDKQTSNFTLRLVTTTAIAAATAGLTYYGYTLIEGNFNSISTWSNKLTTNLEHWTQELGAIIPEYNPYPWTLLTQATFSYGVYTHTTTLSHPALWSVALSTLIPFSHAQITKWNAQFNLSSLNGTNGFLIDGIDENDATGAYLSKGDINGDGIPDLLIGAPYAALGTNKGKAYVLFGSRTYFPSNFDLTNLNGTNGFSITGVNSGDYFGLCLSSADLNDDGIDDMFVGAVGAPASAYRGYVYVIFGSHNPFPATFDLTSLNGTNGFMIEGIYDKDQVGNAVGSGDINHDGIMDLLIGANGAPAGSYRGQSYVVFGTRNPFPAVFNLSNINGTNGLVINGINNSDYFGQSISGGDINGDNITDVLAGAYLAPLASGRGQSFAVFGSRNPPANFNLTNLNGTNGFAVTGINNEDRLGITVNGFDFNDDGIDDFVTGGYSAPSNSSQGYVYVIFGSRNPFLPEFNLTNLNGTNGFLINGINNYDFLGVSISNGDINGDGHLDLLLGASGAPSGTKIGQSYVLFGTATPFPPIFNLTTLNGYNGFTINGVSEGDVSGCAFISCDLNGDNAEDLIVGAFGVNNSTGRVYVIYGKNNHVTTGASATSWAISSDNTSSHPFSLSTVLGIAFGVGVPITVCCLGGITYLLLKNREKLRGEPLSIQIREPLLPQPDSPQLPNQNKAKYGTFFKSIPSRRKIHDMNGTTFEIIEFITKAEAKQLYQQTGLRIHFANSASDKATKSAILGQGASSKFLLARNCATLQFIGLKERTLKESHTIPTGPINQQKLANKPNLLAARGNVNLRITYEFIEIAGYGDGKKLQQHIAQHISQEPQLVEELLIHTGEGLCNGLRLMHQENIYHLDVKLDNVVINKEGEVLVIDFDCSNELTSGEITQSMRGAIPYFSPERLELSFKKIHSINASKVDAWSAGIALLELALNRYPFPEFIAVVNPAFFEKPDNVSFNTAYFKNKLEQIAQLKAPASDSFWGILKNLLQIDPMLRCTVTEAYERFAKLKISNNYQDKVRHVLSSLTVTDNNQPINNSKDEVTDDHYNLVADINPGLGQI